MSEKNFPKLHQLAQLYGIQGAYYDVFKRRQLVNSKSILAILQAMHLPIDNETDITLALHQEHARIWQTLLPPVAVAWNGKLNLPIYLPETDSTHTLQGRILLENQDVLTWSRSLKNLAIVDKRQIDGKNYLVKSMSYSKTLPFGYHHLIIEKHNFTYSCLILSAPRFFFSKPKTTAQRQWGLFAPLYSLNSQQNFGAGDIGDYSKIIPWLAERGGNLLGSLPLFSAFLKNPCEPSPYSPVSKFFFNEFYLDVTSIPEFQNCQKAQELFATTSFQRQLQKSRQAPLVDYVKIMALKRKILEILATDFFANASNERQLSFVKYCDDNSLANDYASFRAVQEKLSRPWTEWSDHLNAGIIHEGEYDPEVKNYHLYVQWQMQQQMTQLTETCQQNNMDLYLDMPLGVHPHGYDAWRFRELFARDLDVGSPVDSVFTEGQNWGFPPLIPHQLRDSHYQYFIRSLRQVLPYVNLLRIDHVMSLHRLYCIPKGFKARDGAYIKYPSDELYAILSIESQRYKTCIIGENLGTVPGYINKAMAQRRLYRMYVLQYEINSAKGVNPNKIPAQCISSLNTHDMPTFSAFVQGLDIKDRRKHNLMTKEHAQQEWQQRKVLNPLGRKLSKNKLQFLLQDCLYKLAASRCRFLLINLEDLWLETLPQNIPISGERYPNWQKKNSLSFEQWRQNHFLCATLNNIAMIRKKRT